MDRFIERLRDFAKREVADEFHCDVYSTEDGINLVDSRKEELAGRFYKMLIAEEKK